MELNVKWHAPIPLTDGDEQNLIYTAAGLEQFEGIPGVYMFCRIFNKEVSPLYIGKAEDIAHRVRHHFEKNTKLMMRIRKEKKRGPKVIVPGQFTPKPGQSTKKCIGVIERALIDHALTWGYNLLNIQGAKTKMHSVSFSGFLGARNVTGQTLSIKA